MKIVFDLDDPLAALQAMSADSDADSLVGSGELELLEDDDDEPLLLDDSEELQIIDEDEPKR